MFFLYCPSSFFVTQYCKRVCASPDTCFANFICHGHCTSQYFIIGQFFAVLVSPATGVSCRLYDYMKCTPGNNCNNLCRIELQFDVSEQIICQLFSNKSKLLILSLEAAKPTSEFSMKPANTCPIICHYISTVHHRTSKCNPDHVPHETRENRFMIWHPLNIQPSVVCRHRASFNPSFFR